MAYTIALEGVTRYGLVEAVKSILRGALGHAFLPSPPEIRQQCEKAMDWPRRQAEQDRIRREHAELRANGRPALTPAQKARHAEMIRNLHASMGFGEEAEEATFRERVIAKYGQAALDAVPDAPRRNPEHFRSL